MNGPLHHLLSEANIALGRLDTMGYLLPNVEHIIAMYVRKEAVLSSQIEGTQASLEDIFEYESHTCVKNVHDVQEVVSYIIKALNHGLKRIEEFPMSRTSWFIGRLAPKTFEIKPYMALQSTLTFFPNLAWVPAGIPILSV